MERDTAKDENFKRVRAEAEIYYDSVIEAYNPHLNEVIAFNRKGLAHVKFKYNGVVRNRSDQFIRLKHIRHSVSIIVKKSGGIRKKIIQEVRYYSFISIIEDKF